MPHFVYSSTFSIYAILLYQDLSFVPEDDEPDAKKCDSIVCHFDNDPDKLNNVRDLPPKRNLVIVKVSTMESKFSASGLLCSGTKYRS